MSIRSDIQNAMKDALRAKQTERLETLRMAKGAILMKEKEAAHEGELADEEAIAVLRAEVRKRRQSIETYREHGKSEEVAKLEREIAVFDEFLPRQMNEQQVEEKVRAYLADHPEVDHPGKLTGAMKREFGDQVDGKLLNEVCRRVLQA